MIRKLRTDQIGSTRSILITVLCDTVHCSPLEGAIETLLEIKSRL